MEPEKKLSRADNSQATPSTDTLRRSQPATHLLDLSDDILGKVYGMVEDSASKKALRHSCALMYRSPTVNSHLEEVGVDVTEYLEEGFADELMDCLQDFPTHATLRVLGIKGARSSTPQIFERALCADASGVRDRLKTVHRLTLEDCNLEDGSTAAYWSALMPRLQDPGGGGELTVQNAHVHANFLSVLSNLTSFRRLSFEDCAFDFDSSTTAKCLPLFKHFTSLTSLKLDLTSKADVQSVDAFSDMHQLERLELTCMRLLYFDHLLQSLPSLHTLGLQDVDLPSESRLSSTSLQVLVLTMLSADFPELRRDAFPAIQALHLKSLYLPGVGGQDLSDEDKVEKVRRTASWLSKWPIVGVGFSIDGINNAIFSITGRTGWSTELSESMFNALSPLKQTLMTTEYLSVHNFNISSLACMSALCNLACNVQALAVVGCVYSGEVLKHGLLKAVQSMTSLKFVSINLTSSVPRDVLAALIAAQQAGRRMLLSFSRSDATCQARLQELREEWLVVKSLLPGPMLADLDI